MKGSAPVRRRLAELEAALRAGSMTRHEIATHLKISPVQAGTYVQHLMGSDTAPKAIFIAEWAKRGTEERPRTVPAYAWMVTGKELDRKKPRPLTGLEKRRRRIAKIRKSPELLARHCALQRIYSKRFPKPDLPAAFFRTVTV